MKVGDAVSDIRILISEYAVDLNPFTFKMIMMKKQRKVSADAEKKRRNRSKPVFRDFYNGNEEDYVYDEKEGEYVKLKSIDDDHIEREDEYSGTKR